MPIFVGAATSTFLSASGTKGVSVGLGQTDTTGRNAGVGTVTGTIIFNSTTGTGQVYTGTQWTDFGDSSFFSATGGTKYTFSTKTIHTFTASGSFVVSNGIKDIEYLIVAGGGSGGNGQNNTSGQAAGGGGGGWFSATVPAVTPGTYPVTVGSGGAAQSSYSTGNDGTSSSVGFVSPVSVNGGGGGGHDPASGRPGGCGGGGGGAGTAGSATNFPGPTQQGFPGGDISPGVANRASGGGGAGGIGEPGLGPGTTGRTANGGIGKQAPSTFRDPSNPFGASGPTPGGFFFSGGGSSGGTLEAPSAGTGGVGPGPSNSPTNPRTPLCGAGNGQNYPRVATPTINGITNTGGGGGATSAGDTVSVTSGSGGSGIVMIAYTTL